MKGKKEIVVLDRGLDKEVVVTGVCCRAPVFPFR